MTRERDAVRDFWNAIGCLYLEVEPSIANDIKARAQAALDAAVAAEQARCLAIVEDVAGYTETTRNVLLLKAYQIRARSRPTA